MGHGTSDSKRLTAAELLERLLPGAENPEWRQVRFSNTGGADYLRWPERPPRWFGCPWCRENSTDAFALHVLGMTCDGVSVRVAVRCGSPDCPHEFSIVLAARGGHLFGWAEELEGAFVGAGTEGAAR